MIHGHRGGMSELLEALQARLTGRPRYGQLYDYLLSQFSDVHCIVFGHTHQPYSRLHDGILLFNPGAVAAPSGGRPSVGILNVTSRSISGRIFYL